MITPKIIEAVEIGILDDDQLEIAIKHYKDLEQNLQCHGEIYRLVWRDVYKKLQELKGYKKSRQEH